MNNKIVWSTLLISIFILACSNQSSNNVDEKHSLITKLINHSDIKSRQGGEKVVVMKTKYCKEFNCEVFFQEYKEHFQFYSKQEGFMRKISDYLEIESIDDDFRQIVITKKTGKVFEKIILNN